MHNEKRRQNQTCRLHIRCLLFDKNGRPIYLNSEDARAQLLSDKGSKTIDPYGVRNKEAEGTRVAGIPHPVTFIIDQKGVIRAKLVRDGYRERPTSAELIKAAKELSGTRSRAPGKQGDRQNNPKLPGPFVLEVWQCCRLSSET